MKLCASDGHREPREVFAAASSQRILSSALECENERSSRNDSAMSTLREHIDVKCPRYYLIHHAKRYFTVHRSGQAPGTFSLAVDMSKVGLPGNVQARHDVRMRYEISKEA